VARQHVLGGAASFRAGRAALPIYAHAGAIVAAVATHAVTVLVGETGSGKTTQVAQYLWEGGLLPHASRLQLVVTQPRRVAAITVARRVAAEMGASAPGTGRVGYAVRFDDATCAATRVKFATDGMLLREAQLDPTLASYAVVVLDEAHERSLATDVLFGVVRRALVARASAPATAPVPPLRVVVMSATLDTDLFLRYFTLPPPPSPSHSPPSPPLEWTPTLLTVPGRQFPVDVYYTPAPVESYLDALVATVLQVHAARCGAGAAGDILAFLPGQDDIESAAELITARWATAMRDHLTAPPPSAARAALSPDAAPAAAVSSAEAPLLAGVPVEAVWDLKVCQLYAALSAEAQLAAFEPPPPATRKVILATNIAETSVTISGVRVVVDCGKLKVRARQEAMAVLRGGGASSSSGAAGGGPPLSHAGVGMSAGGGGSGGSSGGGSSGGDKSGKGVAHTVGAATGMESLAVVDVSRAAAIQRAGRAGREAPGEAYRLFTEAAYDALLPQPLPEIVRVSITSTLLQLLSMGMTTTDIDAFPWLQAPAASALAEGIATLTALRALTAAPPPAPPGAMALSPLGASMAALPLEPTYAFLLLTAAAAGVGPEVVALVALASVEAVWVTPGRDKQGELDAARRKFTSLEGDHITALNVFRSFERAALAAAREAVTTVLPTVGGAPRRRPDDVPATIVMAEDDDGGVASAAAGHGGGGGPSVGRELAEWCARSSTAPPPRGGASSGGTASLAAYSIAAVLRAGAAAAAAAGVDAVTGVRDKAAPRNLLRTVNSRTHAWCVDHFLSFRALRKAVAVRDQLADLCAAGGVALLPPTARAAPPPPPLDLITPTAIAASPIVGREPDAAAVCAALARGLPFNLATRLPGSEAGARPLYRTGDGTQAAIHPASALVLVYSHLRNKAAALAAAAARRGIAAPTLPGAAPGTSDSLLEYPEAVVYGELVETARPYLRQVTRIDRSLLQPAPAATAPVAGGGGGGGGKPAPPAKPGPSAKPAAAAAVKPALPPPPPPPTSTSSGGGGSALAAAIRAKARK